MAGLSLNHQSDSPVTEGVEQLCSLLSRYKPVKQGKAVGRSEEREYPQVTLAATFLRHPASHFYAFHHAGGDSLPMWSCRGGPFATIFVKMRRRVLNALEVLLCHTPQDACKELNNGMVLSKTEHHDTGNVTVFYGW